MISLPVCKEMKRRMKESKRRAYFWATYGHWGNYHWVKQSLWPSWQLWICLCGFCLFQGLSLLILMQYGGNHMTFIGCCSFWANMATRFVPIPCNFCADLPYCISPSMKTCHALSPPSLSLLEVIMWEKWSCKLIAANFILRYFCYPNDSVCFYKNIVQFWIQNFNGLLCKIWLSTIKLISFVDTLAITCYDAEMCQVRTIYSTTEN